MPKIINNIAVLFLLVLSFNSFSFHHTVTDYLQNNVNSDTLVSWKGIPLTMGFTILAFGPAAFPLNFSKSSTLVFFSTALWLGIVSSLNRNNYIGTALLALSSGVTLGYFSHSKVVYHSKSPTYCASNAGVYASIIAGAHLAYLGHVKAGLILAGLGSFLSLSLRTPNDWERDYIDDKQMSSTIHHSLSMNNKYLMVPNIKKCMIFMQDLYREQHSVLNPVNMVFYLINRSINKQSGKVRLSFEDNWYENGLPDEYVISGFQRERNTYKRIQEFITHIRLITRNYQIAPEVFYESIENYKQEMFHKNKIIPQEDKVQDLKYEPKCSHAFLYTYLKNFNIKKDDSSNTYKIFSGSMYVEAPHYLNEYINTFLFLNERLEESFYFLDNIEALIKNNNHACPGFYKFLWFSGFKFENTFFSKEKNKIINYKDIIVDKKSLNSHKNHDENCVFCNLYWTDDDTAMMKEYQQSISQ